MKHLLPLTLALFLAACAAVPITPQDREEARQDQLEKEARENFYALKKQANPNYQPPTPTPAPGLFAQTSQPAPKPARPKSSKLQVQKTSAGTQVTSADGTIYYWDVKSPQPPTANPRYRAAEARYARALAKSPSDLTSEERQWAHEHY